MIRPDDGTEPLKLHALDSDDLQVISTHLQDAVLRVGEMKYLPAQKRFVAILNRFDWMNAEQTGDKNHFRRQSALRFDRVLRAQWHKLNPNDETRTAELLAITFDEAESPGGAVSLIFAGDAALRLEVECIEAELRDLDAVWLTPSRPNHEHTLAEIKSAV